MRRATARTFVFVTRPFDGSDGSRVLADVVQEFAGRYGPARVHLVPPGVEPTPDADSRHPVSLVRTDFVLISGSSIVDAHGRTILRWLRDGRLEHGYWYTHEAVTEVPVARDEALRRRLAKLVAAGRLTVLVPANELKAEYDELFATDLDRKSVV